MTHSSYQLSLKQFSGPLETLLELIEARELQINEISLAQVTDDFLRHLKILTDEEGGGEARERTLEEAAARGTRAGRSAILPRKSAERMRLLADFIAIASRLILIKSKSLLPDLTISHEEEEEIRDLEERLKLYKEFMPAVRLFVKRYHAREREHGRAYFLHTTLLMGGAGGRVFHPGKKLDSALLRAALARTFESFRELQLEEETVRQSMVSLEEKIQNIIERLTTGTQTSFRGLVGSASRSEVVVTFIALLHLARERVVFIEQESLFSDILITKQANAS